MSPLDRNRIIAGLTVAREYALDGESLLDAFSRIAITEVHNNTGSTTRTADALHIKTTVMYRRLVALGLLSRAQKSKGRGRFSKPLEEARTA